VQPLPCSKEIFPVGFSRPETAAIPEDMRPRPVADYLLERMQLAGAKRIFIVLKQGKWDIPAYFGSGKARGLDLAYLLAEVPYGAPFTVRQALPFAADAIVLFGLPDIIFDPADAFTHLLARQRSSGADVTLGLFKATQPHKVDMVELGRGQWVRRIEIKPERTALDRTWLIATWTPVFSAYLASYLQQEEDAVGHRYKAADGGRQAEYYMGHVLQGALADGLRVASVCFEAGAYIDVGTPEDLYRAVREAALKGE
jgi:glucose-1-phosphate thymidylyltransferase